MPITKSIGRKHVFDKFYTRPDVAKLCIDWAKIEDFDVVIEPSAGSGSFSHQIPGCLAFDTAPEDSTIIEQDWFQYDRIRDPSQKVLVIGNPPFGVQNNLARKFINHAAGFADTVAFILPLSFKKTTFHNRLSANMHLAGELLLPRNAFILDGEPYHIPSLFQRWEWKEELRDVSRLRNTSELFEFVPVSQASLFIQRVGSRAGESGLLFKDRSAQSNYFIKNNSTATSEEFVDVANSVVYEGRDYVAGPKTVSKWEIVTLVDEALTQAGFRIKPEN